MPGPSPNPPNPTTVNVAPLTSVLDYIGQYPNLQNFLGNSAVFPDPNPYNVWTDYEAHNRFERDTHTYQLGVTSPGGFNNASVAFVRLATPTLLWICEWTACRYNEQPLIPSPVPADANWVLLDDWIETAAVVTGADGSTPLYRVTGTYIYGHTNPAAFTWQNASFPQAPWLAPFFDRTIPASSVTPDLSDIPRGGTVPPVGPGTALPPQSVPPVGPGIALG